MAKKKADAEKSYKKLIDDYRKALSYFHKSEFEKAKEILKKISQTETPEKEVKRKAGVYLEIIERMKEKPYTPKTNDDYLLHAVFLMNAGDYEKAEKYFKKAKIDDEGKLNYYLSCLYALWGKKDKMIDLLKKAIGSSKIYKEQAKINPDFEDYFEDEDFKKLILENE